MGELAVAYIGSRRTSELNRAGSIVSSIQVLRMRDMLFRFGSTTCSAARCKERVSWVSGVHEVRDFPRHLWPGIRRALPQHLFDFFRYVLPIEARHYQGLCSPERTTNPLQPPSCDDFQKELLLLLIA